MIYDPFGDRYLVPGLRAGLVYAIDPETFNCTILPTSNSAAVNAPPVDSGVFSRFVLAPNLYGMFYLPQYDSNLWFLRLK